MAYYAEEATALDLQVARHQRMKEAYRYGGALKEHGRRMRAHCDKLIASFQAAAAESRAMAQSHREMAASVATEHKGAGH